MLTVNEPKFGTPETVNYYRGYLVTQLMLLRGVLSRPLDNKAMELRVLIATVCNTGSAIAELGSKPEIFHGEMVMLARSFIEKVINFLYLRVCNDEEYKNYFNHTLAKSVRKLDRKVTIGGFTLSIRHGAVDDIKSSPHYQKALDDFTSKAGKEITHWTKVNLEGRLKLIAEACNVNIGVFMLNTLSIYEDASEALHGTLYGCSFFTGAYEPGIDSSNPNEVNENNYKKVSLIFLQLGGMIDEVISQLGQQNEIVDLKNSSNHNTHHATAHLENLLKPSS